MQYTIYDTATGRIIRRGGGRTHPDQLVSAGEAWIEGSHDPDECRVCLASGAVIRDGSFRRPPRDTGRAGAALEERVAQLESTIDVLQSTLEDVVATMEGAK